MLAYDRPRSTLRDEQRQAGDALGRQDDQEASGHRRGCARRDRAGAAVSGTSIRARRSGRRRISSWGIRRSLATSACATRSATATSRRCAAYADGGPGDRRLRHVLVAPRRGAGPAGKAAPLRLHHDQQPAPDLQPARRRAPPCAEATACPRVRDSGSPVGRQRDGAAVRIAMTVGSASRRHRGFNGSSAERARADGEVAGGIATSRGQIHADLTYRRKRRAARCHCAQTCGLVAIGRDRSSALDS